MKKETKLQLKCGFLYFTQTYNKNTPMLIRLFRILTNEATQSPYYHVLFFFVLPKELKGKDYKPNNFNIIPLNVGETYCAEAHVKEGFSLMSFSDRMEYAKINPGNIFIQKFTVECNPEQYVETVEQAIKMAQKKAKYSRILAAMSAYDHYFFIRKARPYIYKLFKRFFKVDDVPFCSVASLLFYVKIKNLDKMTFEECLAYSPGELESFLRSRGEEDPKLYAVVHDNAITYIEHN